MLVGAIANFVTGIGELPYEMATDLISAGRAIGHPEDHRDPMAAACAWKKRNRRSEGASDESEESEGEQYHDTNEFQQSDERNDTNDDPSLEDNDNLSEVLPATSIERRRSLQLEKSQTMDCIDRPKRNSAFNEFRSHGGRMSMKLLKTIIWLPTDLTLSLSKGFHNAPKLYHDQMVKATPKVIGFRSGVRAAGTVSKRIILSSYSELTHEKSLRNFGMAFTTASQAWSLSRGMVYRNKAQREWRRELGKVLVVFSSSHPQVRHENYSGT